MNAVKIDDNTIEVQEVQQETITPVQYNYDYLIHQRDAIQKQKVEQIIQWDKDLAEAEALILECEKLGIKSKIISTENSVTEA